MILSVAPDLLASETESDSHPPLELIEIGGTFSEGNLAAAAVGATSFSHSDYGGKHSVDKLNDGQYGNQSTWIGRRHGSFGGVRLKKPTVIGAIAFGRDSLRALTDRCLGTYCIQYTQVAGADEKTPNDQWTTIATIDYAGSSLKSPSVRHLYRFSPVTVSAVRIITSGNSQVPSHGLGIDELELYAPDTVITTKPALSWTPRFTAPTEVLLPWESPLKKQGYLGSPVVEATPFPFKGKLYLLECWRSNWQWDDQPSETATRDSEIWIAELPEGPEAYDQRKYVSRVMNHCTLGTAIVWDDRVYVFAVKAPSSGGGAEVFMSWTTDMKQWSDPVKVFTSPKGYIFNVAVTRDPQGMVFLWETNAYGSPFTMCYGRVEKPTDPWNPGIIDDARYGMDKYTGGPALYYLGGWYYTLYLEALGYGWETRIARSKDLKTWEDAPENRPFVPFDPKRTGIPLRPETTRECNASDAELCYFEGRTLVYFTGSDQAVGGDLQWAVFDGKPQQLLEAFFADP